MYTGAMCFRVRVGFSQVAQVSHFRCQDMFKSGFYDVGMGEEESGRHYDCVAVVLRGLRGRVAALCCSFDGSSECRCALTVLRVSALHDYS